MSEPFIGEIRIFAGNFAPRGWAFCNGQMLLISQNTPLFSIMGTSFGGDGRTTFALPDLQGRAPVHPGRGPGLTQRNLGQRAGAETVTLSAAELPAHTHALRASGRPGDLGDPAGHALARSRGGNAYHAPEGSVPMSGKALTSSGGGQAHDNMQPFLSLNFIIALVGIYPSRS